MSPANPQPAVASSVSAIGPYLPLLRKYFGRRFAADEVDDLVQEVLIRMQAASRSMVLDYPERYLFRVAASVLADRVRRGAAHRERLHDSLEELHHPVEYRSPERVLLAQEALNRVVAAIERLPERTREIFVLHRFEQTSCIEIAGRLGVSISAVEKHIMKALVSLQRELEP